MVCLNKLESHLALLSITLCWGVQYLFYQAIPESISVFAFMALTSGLGFLILCFVFWGELKNLEFFSFAKGFALSLLSTVFSTLLITGSQSLSASSAAFTGTLFVIFVPILLLVFYRERMPKGYWLSVFFVVAGLGIATDFSFSEGLQFGAVLILIGDVFFAIYIIVLERYVKSSVPSHLAITRTMFSAILSFSIWGVLRPGTNFFLEATPSFWSSVLVVGLFVCGYSTVMQIYAQRYISPQSASLIFSTEIVFTMLFSILLPGVLGKEPVFPGAGEIIGCLLLVFGVILSGIKPPDSFASRLTAMFKKTGARTALIAGALLYAAINLAFRETFIVLPAAGPCAILPLLMGLFFGIPGILSVILGNILADFLGNTAGTLTIFTCAANAIAGGGAYLFWYMGRQSQRPNIKRLSGLARISSGYLAASAAAALAVAAGQAFLGLEIQFLTTFLMYFFWGIFFGLPVGSLLTSVFGVASTAPAKVAELVDKTLFSRSIPNRIGDIGELCESLSEYCESENVEFKQAYGVVLAVEEMLVNIVEHAYAADEEHSIDVSVRIRETVTIRISHAGASFNPVNFQKKERQPFKWKELLRALNGSPIQDMDRLGSLMVTQMAIKAQHKHKNGMNILTIII